MQSGAVCADPLTLLSDRLPPPPSDTTEAPPLGFVLRFLRPGQAGELVTLGTGGGAGMDTPSADHCLSYHFNFWGYTAGWLGGMRRPLLASRVRPEGRGCRVWGAV